LRRRGAFPDERLNKMHLKRWLTSIVALPLLIYLIYRGGLAFAALIAVACALALWEYFAISFISFERRPHPAMVVGFFTALLMTTAAHVFGIEMVVVALALNLFLSAVVFLAFFKTTTHIIESMRVQVQGCVYISLALSLLILIRKGPEGMVWIFFLLAIIFAGDVSAYYFGTYLGRHKLSPSVSPGKTWEGAAGGILANIAVGAIFKVFFFAHLPWMLCLLFFVGIGAAGQIGDLFESAMKRMSGVKDSGFILPGHGGILDRIDALLFAAPVMYFFVIYVEKGFGF
jgi:phosphatidate cytidylyltransferase